MKRLLLIVALVFLAGWLWSHRERSHPPGVIAEAEPVQSPVDNPSALERNGYRIKPLHRFDIEARVLEGRDLLNELAADLRRRIAEKLVERDVLETQLEEVEREGVELSADDLADIVYNLGLEQAGEAGLLEPERDWRPREHIRPWQTNDAGLTEDEEDILDDSD